MMLLIDFRKPYKQPVGSRTSSLPLVTAVLFYNILNLQLSIYRDCTSDHTRSYYSPAIRKATCVLELISNENKLFVLL